MPVFRAVKRKNPLVGSPSAFVVVVASGGSGPVAPASPPPDLNAHFITKKWMPRMYRTRMGK